MSRLDSMIRRLEAQRACLNHAVALTHGMPGPILEIGLGHGRTYDHLRALCPARDIFVFERRISSGAEAVPPADRLVLGDVRDTLPAFARRHPRAAVLLHSDIGTGEARRNATMAEAVADRLPALMRPGGIVLSDQKLASDDLARLPPPSCIAADRYFLYRAG